MFVVAGGGCCKGRLWEVAVVIVILGGGYGWWL